MEFAWSDVIVAVVVASAASYLAWRSWRAIARRRATGCHGCASGCEGQSSATGPDLVALNLTAAPSKPR